MLDAVAHLTPAEHKAGDYEEPTFDLDKCFPVGSNLYRCPAVDQPLCLNSSLVNQWLTFIDTNHPELGHTGASMLESDKTIQCYPYESAYEFAGRWLQLLAALRSGEPEKLVWRLAFDLFRDSVRSFNEVSNFRRHD